MSIRPESRTQVVEMTEEIATEAAKLRSVARVGAWIRLAVRTVTRSYVIRHLDSPYSETWKVLTPAPAAFQIADFSRKRSFLIKKPAYLFTSDAAKCADKSLIVPTARRA